MSSYTEICNRLHKRAIRKLNSGQSRITVVLWLRQQYKEAWKQTGRARDGYGNIEFYTNCEMCGTRILWPKIRCVSCNTLSTGDN